MTTGYTDKLFNGVDTFMRGLSDWVAGTVDHYCMLETCDSEYALAASNGALVTLFEFRGALSQIEKDEFADIITGLNIALSSIFNKPGRALQIVFNYDPQQAGNAVKKITTPALITARNLKLDLEDLVTDWNRTVSRYCAVESCYIAAWTKPDTLSPNERKRAHKEREKSAKNAPAASGKQNVGLIMKAIRHEHDGFVGLLQESFKDQNLIIRRMDAHEALWHMRRMTCPERTSKDWQALLPGDPLPRKYADPGESDYSGFLYPSIGQQLFPSEAEKLDRITLQLGDTLHRPMIMTLPPQNPKPFAALFRYLVSKKIPWRMAMLIEPDGLGGQAFKGLLASILAFTSSDNKMFKNALDDLKEAALEGETIVKLKICFDTWTSAHKDNSMETLSGQAEALCGAIQAWGTCDTTEAIGDPLLGVCATIPAMMDKSPAPAAAPPLADVIKMMPARPASVWDSGSMLLRTVDGKLMPYTPMSSKQASWIEIGAAPMGAGKSVFLSTINLAFLLQPGQEELPWLSTLDIGPSSSGLIALTKSSLPPELKYMAAYHRLRMEPRYAINPCDTFLGCRRPTPNHVSFLVNLLSLFATPLDKSAPGEGVAGMARMSIERAYSLAADDGTPKLYSPGVDSVVSELVEKLDIRIDKDSTWWEIVDELFDLGHIHEAGRAQRYAVPMISDIIGACHQSGDILKMYGEERVSNFTRSLSEAIQAYPILKEPTRFDIGDVRVVSLDLDEVAPRGGAAADRQTAVMYMLGRHIVASKFFRMPEDVNSMPPRYREYHRKQIEIIRKAPKRLACDEVHRITRNQSVVNQFIGDLETIARESRKWNFSIGLWSQRVSDYPEVITELATTVVVLGAGTKKEINELCNLFGFNKALRFSLENLGKPGPKGANFVAMFKTSEGIVYQTLTNTISSMALWAFSSTSEDMTVRNTLYDRLGPKKTLRLLARYYTGGSVKAECERRKLLFEEKSLLEDVKGVEEALIDELIDLSRDF